MLEMRTVAREGIRRSTGELPASCCTRLAPPRYSCWRPGSVGPDAPCRNIADDPAPQAVRSSSAETDIDTPVAIRIGIDVPEA
jgi:hypothetical protein